MSKSDFVTCPPRCIKAREVPGLMFCDRCPHRPRKRTRYLGIHPNCPAGYDTEAELREKMAQYTGWVVGKIEYEEPWS